MTDFIDELRKKVVVGVVGGSDLVKIKEQMGGDSCKELLSNLQLFYVHQVFYGYVIPPYLSLFC